MSPIFQGDLLFLFAHSIRNFAWASSHWQTAVPAIVAKANGILVGNSLGPYSVSQPSEIRSQGHDPAIPRSIPDHFFAKIFGIVLGAVSSARFKTSRIANARPTQHAAAMASPRVSLRFFALHAGAAILWVSLFRFCYSNLFDDPSSYFFDPRSELGLRVAQARMAEVDHQMGKVILAVENGEPDNLQLQKNGPTRWPKRLCLGIVSDPRKPSQDEDSLMRTIVSLTGNLPANNRESMHITILLAAEPQSNHFAFGKPWLSKLVDEVLVYREEDYYNGTSANVNGYREVDFDVNHGEATQRDFSVKRSRIDQAILMDVCRETHASYVALVEPHFVAIRDWHARLVSALAFVNKAARSTGGDWAYIKLFDHSQSQWRLRNHDWVLKSMSWSLEYVAAVLTGAGLRRWAFHKKRVSVKVLWQDSLLLLSLVVWVPVFVRLLDLAGGMDSFQHHFWPYVGGVREITREGCCGNGVILQRRHLEEFERIFRSPPYDSQAAEILDQVGREKGLSRWVVDPSIML